jgi:hypothetical protein
VVAAVFSVVAVTRQLQALESFFGLFEQYVAKAGRPVIAVCDPVVYVAQKGAATPEETVKTEAQASPEGSSHAKIKGTKETRVRTE